MAESVGMRLGMVHVDQEGLVLRPFHLCDVGSEDEVFKTQENEGRWQLFL